MTVKNPKKLVIDASIAGAAGDKDAIHPTSKQCYDFLTEVRSTGHQMVMTPAIFNEWNEHQSKFASSWLAIMQKRTRIVWLNTQDVEDITLRDALRDHANQDSPRDEMLKDVHLLEAALVMDRTVAADDRRVRRYFCNMCEFISEIRDVVWVNPTIEDENCIDWLRKSAPADEHRKLGYEIE